MKAKLDILLEKAKLSVYRIDLLSMSFYFSFNCLKYLVLITARKTVTEIMTIVPPGAKFITYDITIPPITDRAAVKIDINNVFLNPLPNIIAVIFGITINEEISKTPTSRTEVITVTLASTMKR